MLENFLKNPFIVSYLKNLNGDPQQVQNFYDRVRSDMMAKKIKVSIKKTSI